MNNFDRFLLILCVLMLGTLTVGQAPLQKAADALNTKYERQGRAQVCQRLFAMKEVYDQQMRTIFIAGCRWDVITLNIQLINANKKKDPKKELEKFGHEVEDVNSQFNDQVNTHCSSGASEWERDGLMTEQIVSDLYANLKCSELESAFDK